MLNFFKHILSFSPDFISGIKPVFYILSLTIFPLQGQQNLVPNASFEDTVFCPAGTNNPNALSSWYNASLASPDYYNACANNGGGVPVNDWGYQYAQDGNAYIGLGMSFISPFPNYREYMQVRLSEKLQAGKTYCWSFWISLIDSVDFASDNMGIGLSQGPVTNSSIYTLLPITCIGFDNEVYTDRNNWKEVSGTYTAIGNEEYLTLGNFFDDLNTNYIQVASGAMGGPYAYYYIDNVYLGECIPEVTNPNVFTPDSDGLNDVFFLDGKNVKNVTLTILNRWGNTVYYGEDTPVWDGKQNGIECPEGVYFYIYTFRGISEDQYEKKTGFVQLIR